MSPSESKRNAVEAAARPLRVRQRAESSQLAAAESALRRADREHDRALRKARGRPLARPRRSEAGELEPESGQTGADGPRTRAITDTRTVLGELGDLVEESEEVLDMAAGINSGHDGVIVVTDRRLVFIAPRRKLSLRHDKIVSVEVRGRRLGTRIVVSLPEGRTTFSGIRQRHANDLAELVRERTPAAG